MHTEWQGNGLELGVATGQAGPVRITADDRSTHLYAVGSTGTGKSKFLEGLIRQDILSWPRTQCGLMLLDPHGALYDSIMAWAASRNLHEFPIVPIDLRRRDFVVAYNLLRKREGAEPAVIVGNFIRGMVHAWGAGDLNDTPRLAKWLWALLITIYENQWTLAETMFLIRTPLARRRMAQRVKNRLAKSIWELSAAMTDAAFFEEVESTVNRLTRFLGTEVMEASLCQQGRSLDLSAAIEEGQIVLACLSTERTRIDDEDASAFGSLLLNDLWTAARWRGTGDSEPIKPFYLYADEFQNYVTPMMGRALAEARKYGLHMTLAHQYPSQLPEKSRHGLAVFNSVMANARTKVVFQIDHPQDLPVLTEWLFRTSVDVDQVKYQGYTTKVLGHELRYVDSYSRSTGRSESESRQWSDTETQSRSRSIQQSRTDGVTSGKSREQSHTQGANAQQGRSHTSSRGETESATDNWQNSTSASDARSSNVSAGTTESVGLSGKLAIDFEDPTLSFENEFLEPQDAARSWSRSATAGEGSAESRALTHGASAGGSLSRSTNRGEQDGLSESAGVSTADSVGISRSDATNTSNSTAVSETSSEGISRSYGGSESISYSESETVASSPMLFPIMGREASTPVFRSVDEQMFRFTQYLAAQPNRHCVARLPGGSKPVPMVTVDVAPPLTTPEWRDEWAGSLIQQWEFALPLAEAVRLVRARDVTTPSSILGPDAGESEATTTKRRLPQAPKGPVS